MRSGTKIKLGAVSVVLIALFVFANLTGYSKNIRNFFYNFSAPIQKNLWMAGDNVSAFFTSFFSAGKLKVENEKLTSQNQDLTGQLAAMKELQAENETLRGALNIGLNKNFRMALAQVASKDIGQDSVLIDKGSKDGMAEGMPVITGQKVLIGKIAQVYDRYSQVKLITSPNFSFGVRVADRNILGEAKGLGGLKLSLDRIPQGQNIKDGDIVTSVSLGGIFPQGLLVGKIQNITKNDAESFQKADIQPDLNIDSLDNIFIIIDF
jgi:rod shape-determining protein MreC